MRAPRRRSAARAAPRTATSPSLGEHLIEVLRELGYDERQVRDMVNDGAAIAMAGDGEGDGHARP